MPELNINGRKPRVLLAIASFGDKSLHFLQDIIRTWQAMPLDLEIVVHSNIPKDLGPGIKVVVGLPSKNPWSLPFAHKQLFADNVDRHDLFVYSEDDMAVTEANVRAFLQVTPQLEAGEIAGYLRYEVDAAGTLTLPDLHGYFHWKPDSVGRRGDCTVAEFTNEHAGFYILTQSQLRKIVASGGYLRSPCDGRYGMPETAATDPYTICGFKKVVCISAVDDFLIHHMPNKYVGRLGITLAGLRRQVEVLGKIADRKHPASVLCEVESGLLHSRWSKCYDEKPSQELLELLPEGAKKILSIGAGNGALETRLLEGGAKVTVLPLDSVVGAGLERPGLEVIYGTLDECFASLAGTMFDAVVMTNLLHLLPDPKAVLDQCARRVGSGGVLVLSGPNFGRVPALVKRVLGGRDSGHSAARNGRVNMWKPASLAKCVEQAGLRIAEVRWPDRSKPSGGLAGIRRRLGGLTAHDWMLQACR